MTAVLQALGSSGVVDALSGAASVGAGIQGFVTSRQNAKMLEEAGKSAESESLRESAKLLGAQRAAYAASGVELTGTPLDVLAQTAQQEAMDALRIRYGYKAQAHTERLAGTASFTGGLLEGVTKARTGYDKRRSVLTGTRYRLPRSGEGFTKAPFIPSRGY